MKLRSHAKNNTCPWWIIGAYDNPLRQLMQKPERILAGLVEQEQTVLDVGPGVGYFTIPMARLVGKHGVVIAADLQPEMLAGLRRRAEQAGVLERIETHLTKPEQIGVTTPIDFALAFWMLHEVRQPDTFLAEIYNLLKPSGRLLLVEPIIHVSKRKYDQEVQAAVKQGFTAAEGPEVAISRSVLLNK